MKQLSFSCHVLVGNAGVCTSIVLEDTGAAEAGMSRIFKTNTAAEGERK